MNEDDMDKEIEELNHKKKLLAKKAILDKLRKETEHPLIKKLKRKLG